MLLTATKDRHGPVNRCPSFMTLFEIDVKPIEDEILDNIHCLLGCWSFTVGFDLSSIQGANLSTSPLERSPETTFKGQHSVPQDTSATRPSMVTNILPGMCQSCASNWTNSRGQPMIVGAQHMHQLTPVSQQFEAGHSKQNFLSKFDIPVHPQAAPTRFGGRIACS